MIFVYDLIEELCIKKGVNVTTLCKECKIPRSTLTDYKKGRVKTLSADTLCKIADYFGVSVGYLCGSPFEAAKEEQLKALIFGEGTVVTAEMWQEIKDYALFVKQKYSKNSK
ncbi:MAG: helix-turn-helix transcriptional regulator [Clostridia bacterium]|nr:helix-turn-helix transcriptional regulator [Clostridia bacterium]